MELELQETPMGKNFGIGYVENLEGFEKSVNEDLLHAIKENFQRADLSKVQPHEQRNYVSL